MGQGGDVVTPYPLLTCPEGSGGEMAIPTPLEGPQHQRGPPAAPLILLWHKATSLQEKEANCHIREKPYPVSCPLPCGTGDAPGCRDRRGSGG